MGITRVLVVLALAVVGFVAALMVLDDVPFSECQADAARDPAYRVAMQPTEESFILYGADLSRTSPRAGPPRADVMTYQLTVTENGQPVSGADVCLRADRRGAGRMPGLATSAVAHETSPGEYGVRIRFETAGHWNVHALIRRPGQVPVDVPFAIQAL
jgi:hypothetical protein